MSNPIVPFRETIVEPPKVDMVNELIETQTVQNAVNNKSKDEDVHPDGSITQKTPNKKSVIKIRAKPLPSDVLTLLENSYNLLRSFKDCESYFDGDTGQCVLSDSLVSDLGKLKINLQKSFEAANWDPSIVESIWSFGPKMCGPNILVNQVPGFKKGSPWLNTTDNNKDVNADPRDSYSSNFVNGFQMATSSGPLCEEPMVGVCFVVEDWTLKPFDSSDSTNQPFGPFSGQIMFAVKEGCRKAFQAQPLRLMVAMYSCSIQVNSEVLGKFDLESKFLKIAFPSLPKLKIIHEENKIVVSSANIVSVLSTVFMFNNTFATHSPVRTLRFSFIHLCFGMLPEI